MMNFEITKEDILAHFEDKILEALDNKPYQDSDGEYHGGSKFTPLLGEIIHIIADKLKNQIWEDEKKQLQARIQEVLDNELMKILNNTFQPVNHWGDKDGQPTTIKQIFIDKSKDYWLQQVDSNGKASDKWGAKMSRAEFVTKGQIEAAFRDVMNSEIAVVVSSFKSALTTTMKEQAATHIEDSINKLIRVNN